MARPPLRVPQASIGGPDLKAETDLLQRGHHAQAERRLATLRRQFPTHARVLALHGDALQGLDRHQDAVTAYRAALAGGLDGITLRLGLAASLVNSTQPQEALDIVDAILEKNPEHPKALSIKCAAHYGLSQPRQARQAGRQALALNPRDVSVLETMAHLDTFAANSAVFDVLPGLLEKTTLAPQKQAKRWAVLGKAYLDINEPAKAFEHYQRANELMDNHLPPIRSELERLLTFTRQHFTPSLFDHLSPHGLASRPQIMVAGMSRSGKSLVESLFQGVAGVHLAGEDPVLAQYRDELLQQHDANMGYWLAQQTPDSIAAQAAEYARRLQALNKEHNGNNIAITTMPGDLWNLGLIGLWAPKVPIIFTVRNVLDLGVTGYFQQYEHPQGYRYSYNLHHMGRQIACFEKVMEHWAQVLPNPVYLVDYEALVADPQTVMNNLLTDLGLEREQAYDDIVGENAGMADAISPIVSFDTPMPMTDRFIGFSEPFRDQLEPLIQGYQTIVQAFPRLEPPATLPVALPDTLVDTESEAPNPSDTVSFNWELEGRIVVVDQGARLLQWPQASSWMELGSFDLVAFDAMGDAATGSSLAHRDNVQCVSQALLGDGAPATLHVCLDADYTSTFTPLPADQLAPSLRQKTMVLAKLALPTHRLDSIEGLQRLDWLVLDERHHHLSVLEHGRQALKDTLLIHANLNFMPVYKHQNSLAELMHWASHNGFQFHRLVDMQHQQAMEERNDLPQQPEGTALERAAALLLPDTARLASLTDTQRLKLAFMLDTVYGLHDVVYTVLHQVGSELADNYLKAKGYFDQRRGGPAGDTLASIRQGMQQGRLAEQSDAIRQLMATYKNDAQVSRLRAEFAWWQGQGGHALPLINQAIKAAPDDLGIRLTGIGILLGNGLWWEAHHEARMLLDKAPDHPGVQTMVAHTVATHPRPDEQEVQQALAWLLEAEAVWEANPAQLALVQSIRGRLQAHLGDDDAALASHKLALQWAANAHAWNRARAHYEFAFSLHRTRQLSAACDALWEAASITPASPWTGLAQRQLALWLRHLTSGAEERSQAWSTLASLHHTVAELRAEHRSNLPAGAYGLLPQGLASIRLAGLRPTEPRLRAYQLEDWLPTHAHALDADANQGLLLLGLASHIAKGVGLSENTFNHQLFETVATHLNIHHIQLEEQAFATLPHQRRFHLILACGIHSDPTLSPVQIGKKCYELTHPDGIVLLESRGTGGKQIEPGFTTKVDQIAAQGFTVVHSGEHIDDGRNQRMFALLKRESSPPNKT